MKITVVVENTAAQAETLGEHGLSFWIETDADFVLFDAGRAVSFCHNVAVLKIPLDKTDAVVLSHGHYDHTGGLAWALTRAGYAKVFLHPESQRPRFSIKDGRAHAIGMPDEAVAALRAQASRLVWTTQPTEMISGVFATGPIPRRHLLEDTGGAFFLDASGQTSDRIVDDQALWLETQDGLIVLLGCAHSGAINTLDYIMEITGRRPLLAVLGGMHLGAASAERLAWTLNEIGRFKLSILAPMHCTGLLAISSLWGTFPGICRAAGAGAVFEWNG